MRKQLAIGVSLFLLCGLGGKSENIDLFPIQALPLKYTHLIETSQSQTFEPYSRANLIVGLPYRSTYKTAKVTFISGDSDINFGTPSFPVSYKTACENAGYKLTKCTSGNPTSFCPYDTTYFKECCDSAYKYSKYECSYPNTISANSCGGKFKCYCDTTLYPYTTSNCTSPKELSDKCVDDNGAHYSTCKCPSYYRTCDASLNLVGVGTACTQNGQSVYASCECKSGYNQICEEFGPVNANDYCLNGIKYYNSCKTCGNYGYMSSCPTGIECSFEQCSGKYFPTGQCSNGYTDISDASCEWYRYWMPCTTAPERPENS